MARQTTLTAEVAKKICDILEGGNYLETAAQASEVSINTVYSWLRKGREGLQPFEAFAQAVTRARAVAEVNLVAVLRGGDGEATSFGPAKAAAHILAVTRPQRFATRVNSRVREQLTEFTRFLEGQLTEILGETQGAEVFEKICDRWLNRLPVDVADGHGGGEMGDHSAGAPGGETLN